MSGSPQFRRRNRFIKKGFQLNFSVRFLTLIIIEAILLAGLFWYMSLNTLTTSYQGAQLRIENTSSFFFPSMVYPGLIVIGVVCITGIVGLIFISHKIAGPLYRFEKSLKAIGEGDLTHRISLRSRDQLSEMADTLNNFTSKIEDNVMDMKLNINASTKVMGEIQPYLSSGDASDIARITPLFEDLSKKLTSLQGTVEQLKTTEDLKDNDSKAGKRE